MESFILENMKWDGEDMYIRRDKFEVFVECEFCKKLVPCGLYCSSCGKRQFGSVDIRKLSSNEQTKCKSCGEKVYKDNNCSNCGFLLQ